MKVSVVKPEVLEIDIRCTPDDELYHSCMWARIVFDTKNWSMMAQSDCGDYSYGWCVESGSRSFLELMQSLDAEYLLGKVSNRTWFDEKASKESILSYLDGEDISEDVIKEIKNIRACSEMDFINQIDDIDELKEYELWECPVNDYPPQARTFAKLFVEVVEPKIREYLRGESE